MPKGRRDINSEIRWCARTSADLPWRCNAIWPQEKHIGSLDNCAGRAREMDAAKPVLACEMALEALQALWRKPSFQEIQSFPPFSVTSPSSAQWLCPMATSKRNLGERSGILVQVEPLSVFVDPAGESCRRIRQIRRDLLDIPCPGEDAQ